MLKEVQNLLKNENIYLKVFNISLKLLLLLQQGEQETKENKETITLSWWDNILLQEGIYLILQLFLM